MNKASASVLSGRDRVLGGLWGALVGDALGVPVEFSNREDIRWHPVTGMSGYGTHHQPPGTWSDDGALVLCTIDSLLHTTFDLEDLGRRFVKWMNESLWSAHGEVFDIGGATCDALTRIANGTPAEEAGGLNECDNGNGSLMRILPVALRFSGEPVEVFQDHLERASAITHGHARSRMACVLYGLVARELLAGSPCDAAIVSARAAFIKRYGQSPELRTFQHLLQDDFWSLREEDIVSTGYVLHTLHASLWCLLQTDSFERCVLKAVNLGGDTDTTGCVAGGLAGVAYGAGRIPKDWTSQLARHQDLECLFQRFAGLIEPE